ncbi:BCL-6 corepressor isoform X1 [Electrophorus electricus]|uniref:BCL-6 corepressor n=1 Tax=Electrophorus electricus TaxID=8005 RepID=A0A4W4FHD8_ELEEL|nr:BCL-6 corepressor isoform X1 [Electrophorus electricus]
MVDASAACRMNPLAALGIDRSSLMRENLHVHGSMVYPPGIRTLQTEKSYVGDRIPDLLYKPDVSLDSRKATNGYVGLYKSPPPGIQKPLVVPGTGTDTLGLDRHVGPVDKPSELGLNGGSGSYLRLPWVSPYHDAGMYPFLDSTKYAALNMYKASFMSQPSPYLPQHLAYQSLCAGAGGSAAGAERLFYMPPYPPTPISSPLPPPLRIPTATVAPAALSPLVHHQDKTLQSIGPRIHHDPSAFGQQPLHQQTQSHHQPQNERQHPSSGSISGGGGSKSNRTPSSKSSTSHSSSISSTNSSSTNTCVTSSSSVSIPVDSSPSLVMQAPRSAPRPSQPPGAPPPLVDSTSDFQKSVFRSPSSSLSSSSSPAVSHPFYLSQEHRSPIRPASQKPKCKEGSSEQHRAGGNERKGCSSPAKTSTEKPTQQGAPTKDPADKPLDLSAKIMDFEGPPNGFPPSKLEALAKLGYSPSSRYGLPPSRELLKETLSPSSSTVSTSCKTPERPEIISTLPSSWVVPSTAQALSSESNHIKGSTVIKNKNLDHVIPQPRSSSCPRIGEPNSGAVPNPAPVVVTSACRPSSASPSPKVNGDWPKSTPTPPDKPPPTNRGGGQPSASKPAKTPKKSETPEIGFKPQQPHIENGHPPSHLYMAQGESYLPTSLAYANRYLPYSVPESMSLPHLPLSSKGPVYPHPVLLSNTGLYSTRMPHKPALPYGLPPSHGDYLTYHDSQEMVHPLMSPHLPLDPKVNERLERRSRPQEKTWQHEESPYKQQSASDTDTRYKPERESEGPEVLGSKPPSKPHTASKEEIVCIDLAQDDTDGSPEPDKYSTASAKQREPSKPAGSGTGDGTGSAGNSEGKAPELMQILRSSQPVESKPAEPDRQPEPHSPPETQERPESPTQSQGDEESSSERSPLPPLLEEQTLRCARTSGDRVRPDAAGFKADRHHAIRQYMDLGKGRPENAESHEDEDDGHGCSKSKRSSLAKRIANSSGYVGDRFKCVTTELYADSSKLSREQRALQMDVLAAEDSNLSQPASNCERAMMRFSELELKEKEGCASTAGLGPGLSRDRERERTSADTQHRDTECERGLQCTRPPAGRTEQSELHNGANRVPVLQRCGPLSSLPHRHGDERRPAREQGQGPVAAAAAVATPRKRTLTQEMSQGHPDGDPSAEERERDGESERAREKERDEEDDAPAKRARLTAVLPGDAWRQPSEQEVKNLKVCIELTGLRLSKPRQLQSLQELWARQGALPHGKPRPCGPSLGPTPAPAPFLPSAPAGQARREQPEPCPPEAAKAPPCAERRSKTGGEPDKGARHRGEEERGWGRETLGYPDGNTAVPVLSGVCSPDASACKPPPLPPSRLSDKRLRLKERRKSSSSPSPDPADDLSPRLRCHGDPEKPKGKRQCKTKHLGQRELRMITPPANEECPELCPTHPLKVVKRCALKRAASPSDYEPTPVKPRTPSPASPADPPSPPPPALPAVAASLVPLPTPVPAEPPASRPMPPEARRLIVNKNAGETLLQRAARLGYEEVVLYCLENKVCDVNHRDNAGYCALHEACARGWLSIVQHLLEHGADINCSAQDGTRPLHDAVENDHLDVVRLLLSYGADPTLATYSGRGLLKMTHSDLMEGFLSDYFADLQGRPDDDPSVYWEFYGSAVCEPAEDAAAFDVLANPPGPDEDEDEHREVFEFEFSDRPLLPCYNIQVSLSQGPRNWLLLSDVLKRLKMSARAFRSAFSHIEVVTIAEAEFYKQASLSQLFSCPEELEAFLPDSKELLDLVEISAELVALLGSSLEYLDDH